MQIAKQTGEPHFYMMELAPGLIIDARTKGNVARLINSSCAPNCESQKWHDAANGVIILPIGKTLSAYQCHKRLLGPLLLSILPASGFGIGSTGFVIKVSSLQSGCSLVWFSLSCISL